MEYPKSLLRVMATYSSIIDAKQEGEKIMYDLKNLDLVKTLLKKNGHHALLLRSTDKYFNEYVPKEESNRFKITGFSGSVGDAIISQEENHLFVDGRYVLQAKNEAKDFIIHVSEQGQSIEACWLQYLAENFKAKSLAIDAALLDLELYKKLENLAQKNRLSLVELGENYYPGQGGEAQAKLYEIWSVDESICGLSVKEKIALVNDKLKSSEHQALFITKLDDIAWLLNMRTNRFCEQTSVPGLLAVLKDKILWGMPKGCTKAPKSADYLQIVDEKDFFASLKNIGQKGLLGVDERECSRAHIMALQKENIPLKSLPNPVSLLKAQKNEKELSHMRKAFHKADEVVYQTQNFVTESFEQAGQKLSEAQVDHFVRQSFTKSKAQELSFRPICASGKNGAIIHYGTADAKNFIESGSLFLLDTGAYYEGGYATDLTRTFLAGPKNTKAKAWQKEIFTLVLKASIKGLSARLRKGSVGMQLDAIVREPLWQRALDFAHGTGHGVGINVHECPPRIAPGSSTPLLERQVFSIEPGLYFEGLGGVRIENLATIVADPDDKNFVRVLPLTFCPFDERLIDEKMLNAHEQNFLLYFKAQWEKKGAWPALPPLPTHNIFSTES